MLELTKTETHLELVVLNYIPSFVFSLETPIFTFLQDMGQYTSYANGCFNGREIRVFFILAMRVYGMGNSWFGSYM